MRNLRNRGRRSFFDEKGYELLPVINDFFESNKNDYVQKVAEKEKNTGLSIYDADFREPYLEKNITDSFPDEIVIDTGNGPERFRVEKAALHLESGAVVLDLNLTPLGPAEEIPDYDRHF